MSEFSVGQHIGDYEIISILGVGGMGKVYKVRNVIADRVEAMKILLPDLNSNQSLADRFLREIRLLATLNHPNIAALRTALTYQNQLVMVMEFVEGETLANRVARAPLSTADAVNYADQVLSALSYAHKQNIIHRDIKPANIMLTPQGVVKLMDFGIARSVATDGSLTTTGTTLGSLNYMPPEQVRGEAADARSDIYSFGVSLYEMLTGQLPFKGDSQYSLMTAHLNEVPAAPITLRSDLPAGLSEIIMIAIAKDPANRFQSADAFRAALASVPVSDLPRSSTTVNPTPRPSSGGTTIVEPIAARVPTPAPAMRTPTPPPPATPLPTVPMAASPAVAPAVPPVGARPSGSRGVWLAIGAMLGVFVLIAAGMYLPRHFGTHADPSKAAFPAQGSAADPTPPAAPATNDATPIPPSASDSSKPIVSMQGPVGSIAVDGNGNVAIEGPSGGMHVNGSTGAVSMTGKTGKIAVTLPAVPQVPSSPQSGAAPPPGPSPEEIAKAEDEADKLNVRAAAATQSIDTLRRQQLAAGYNLRADISSSEQRMQVDLAKGNAALTNHDLKNAQKYFDLADAELSKIEKFLGH
jgi:eukaryotic-like serine/threonine-protein kinase